MVGKIPGLDTLAEAPLMNTRCPGCEGRLRCPTCARARRDFADSTIPVAVVAVATQTVARRGEDAGTSGAGHRAR